jgi:hypothetical protein
MSNIAKSRCHEQKKGESPSLFSRQHVARHALLRRRRPLLSCQHCSAAGGAQWLLRGGQSVRGSPPPASSRFLGLSFRTHQVLTSRIVCTCTRLLDQDHVPVFNMSTRLWRPPTAVAASARCLRMGRPLVAALRKAFFAASVEMAGSAPRCLRLVPFFAVHHEV